jgi:GNAT superfamily N-acetyltransferase
MDPDQYTETIRGAVTSVDDEGTEKQIGSFEGYRLRVDWAAEEGESFWDIADAFSGEAHDYLLQIFDDEGELRPEVEAALGEEPPWGPVLMAHKLDIEPAHRGQGLGYAVVDSFIETFEPGVGIVIAQAAPINPSDLRPGEAETPEYRRWRARGVQKLRKYWEGFGFVPVSPASDYLALNLALRRPPLDQLIRRLRAKKRRSATRRRTEKSSGPDGGGAR